MKTWVLFKRELRRLFFTWTLAVFIPAFLVLAGISFNVIVNTYAMQEKNERVLANPRAFMHNPADGIFRPYLGQVAMLFFLFLPLLTMRAFAAEKASGELDLWQSYPLGGLELFLGKYLACLLVVALMIFLAALVPCLGDFRLDVPERIFAAGVLGLFLYGAAFTAIGLFASTLVENSALAGVLAFLILVGLWSAAYPAVFFDGFTRDALEHLSPLLHLDFFLQGVIQTRDLTFFINVSLFFATLAVWRLGARRELENG